MKRSKFNLNSLDSDLFETEREIEEDEVNEDVAEIVEDFLKLDYPVNLVKDEDEAGSYWIAEHPDLPGCKSHGDTKEAAIKNLDEAKVSWMYSYADLGKEIPRPTEQGKSDDFSGKILLRIPKDLHCKLTRKAKRDGISLNQEILYLLSHALGETDMNNYFKKISAELDNIQRHLMRESRTNSNFKADDIEDLVGKYTMSQKSGLSESLEETIERQDRHKHKFKIGSVDEYFESSFFQ